MKKTITSALLWRCAILWTIGGIIALLAIGWNESAVISFVSRTAYLFLFILFTVLVYGEK